MERKRCFTGPFTYDIIHVIIFREQVRCRAFGNQTLIGGKVGLTAYKQ